MTPKRSGAIIRKIKDITIGSTLSLTLLTGTGILQSCGDNQNQQEQQYETALTKGMQTRITETEKGVFKITDEQAVDEGQSKAIVTFLNGSTDTLSIEQAKRIVESDTTSQNNGNNGQYSQHSGGYGLQNALLYGGLGYFLGRSLSRPTNSAYYASPQVYQRVQPQTTTLRNSQVTRPVNSSRGYFGSGSRSSGGA